MDTKDSNSRGNRKEGEAEARRKADRHAIGSFGQKLLRFYRGKRHIS